MEQACENQRQGLFAVERQRVPTYRRAFSHQQTPPAFPGA